MEKKEPYLSWSSTALLLTGIGFFMPSVLEEYTIYNKDCLERDLDKLREYAKKNDIDLDDEKIKIPLDE